MSLFLAEKVLIDCGTAPLLPKELLEGILLSKAQFNPCAPELCHSCNTVYSVDGFHLHKGASFLLMLLGETIYSQWLQQNCCSIRQLHYIAFPIKLGCSWLLNMDAAANTL